ncbi:trigger factor [uncultured Thermanaerothrix sp.]|uniref:trigger factor n=1 Tax=uncultured Thermanaerothrix sp. TaxID=1195149 RepID=UPI00261424E7|nr:trigger factor [uncultured Thermanaerothrix sp.]
MVNIIEKTQRDDHQVYIVAEFEPEVWEDYKRKATRKLGERVRIPGFRPGKAPLEMVRRTVGNEAIEELAIEMLIDDKYGDMLKTAEVNPGAPGRLENILSREPLRLAFVVPLEPVVELGDYHKIRVESETAVVSEEEVEEYIQNILLANAVAEPVDRPAQDGDVVYVKYQWAVLEGEETPSNFSEPEAAEYLIGRKPETERPFPGFSAHLVGLTAEQETSFVHEFPQDWEQENLRGKKVVYRVVVQSVKQLSVPELTDEFVQSVFPELNSVDDLRKRVRTSLEASHRAEADSELAEKMLNRIREQATLKYPPQLVEEEISRQLTRWEAELRNYGLNLESYLRITNKDPQTFINETIRPAAIQALERRLLVDKLIQQENIQLSQEAYQRAVESLVGDISRLPKREQKRLGNRVSVELERRLSNELVSELIERLKAIASGQIEKMDVRVSDENTSMSESTGETPTNNPPIPQAEAVTETAKLEADRVESNVDTKKSES